MLSERQYNEQETYRRALRRRTSHAKQRRHCCEFAFSMCKLNTSCIQVFNYTIMIINVILIMQLLLQEAVDNGDGGGGEDDEGVEGEEEDEGEEGVPPPEDEDGEEDDEDEQAKR